MKKSKYIIAFDYCDKPMSEDIEITKKEFERQLDFLRLQVRTSKDDEEDQMEELEPKERDFVCYTETSYFFSRGCATTYLTKLVCKRGYQFKQ